MTTKTIAIALLAGVTALTGCAASGSGAPQDDLSYEDSPLSAFLGGDVEFDEDEYEATEREVQESIAACMADEGFEYVPVDVNAAYAEEDLEAQDTEEWVAQHGYGIATADEPAGEEPTEDPNADYVEALSPGEQQAYYDTLYGPMPSEDELADDGSYAYDWQDAGCQGAADHEVRGDVLAPGSEHDALLEAMGELYERVAESPDMVDLDAEWSACMADAGHTDLEDPNAAWERAMDDANALWGEDGSEPSDEATAAVREAEIELALADLRCREELDYDDGMLTVQFALEEQFIEDHRAELEAYRASIEQGS